MGKSKFEISKTEGVHKQLEALTGSWKGVTKTWFEPNVVADESPMQGTIRPTLGGRFLLHEYQGSLNGEPFDGLAIFGFDLANNRFESAWIDSFHMGTGMMLSKGTSSPLGFSVLGSYGSPEYPEPWGWRTTVELTNPNELVITAYNISPEGQEDKATETVYTRTH